MSKTIVFIPGTWDLFHIGHLKVLQKAKALGDVLVVGVQSDRGSYKIKGSEPTVSCKDRMALLEGLACVDIAVEYDEDYPTLVTQFDVDVVCLGDDYRLDSRLEEVSKYMRKRGGRIIRLPRTSLISTTDIKKSIRKELNGTRQ